MTTLHAPSTSGQISGPPWITLVDVDGGPVGPGEKNIPDVRPEPSPADRWPRWTDLVVCKPGRRDHDLDHAGPVLMGDAFRAVMQRAERCEAGPDDFDCEADCEPLPGLPDHRSPEEWEATEPGPIEPPGDWEGSAAAGWALSLPPISGGSPEPDDRDAQDHRDWLASVAGPETFTPSPADLAEMHAHRDATEVLYGYE